MHHHLSFRRINRRSSSSWFVLLLSWQSLYSLILFSVPTIDSYRSRQYYDANGQVTLGVCITPSENDSSKRVLTRGFQMRMILLASFLQECKRLWSKVDELELRVARSIGKSWDFTTAVSKMNLNAEGRDMELFFIEYVGKYNNDRDLFCKDKRHVP